MGSCRAGLARGQAREMGQSNGQQAVPKYLAGEVRIGKSCLVWIGTDQRPFGWHCPWLGLGWMPDEQPISLQGCFPVLSSNGQ